MRAVGLILAALILAFSAFNGLREGPGLLSDAANGRQQVVAIGQIISGVTALVALIGLWRRQGWALAVTSSWALATIVVGSVASIAWTDVNIGVALLAGLITAIITGWVVWFVWDQSRSWRSS
jgi:ribose/xylose/arabinose/galactoside ABC-type transport system permease subunit